MYTKIIDPNIIVFDEATNDFVGRIRFQLSPQSENALLQLVNYNKTPDELLLMNLNFDQQSTNFDPTILINPVRHKGLLKAIFKTDNGELVPIEIRLRYDAIAHGNILGSRYFFESVGYDNIEVDSVEQISY